MRSGSGMGVPVPSMTIVVRGDCAARRIGARRISARRVIGGGCGILVVPRPFVTKKAYGLAGGEGPLHTGAHVTVLDPRIRILLPAFASQPRIPHRVEIPHPESDASQLRCSRPQSFHRPTGFSRWRVPPAALAIHLAIGQAYAFSVFNLPLSTLIGGRQARAGGLEALHHRLDLQHGDRLPRALGVHLRSLARGGRPAQGDVRLGGLFRGRIPRRRARRAASTRSGSSISATA